jgi:hypothetical protein
MHLQYCDAAWSPPLFLMYNAPASGAGDRAY